MSLETRLKETLIEQRADKVYHQFSSDPQYRMVVGKIVEEFGNYIVEYIASTQESLEPERKDDMLLEYREKVLPQLITQFYNPEQLRQTAIEQARAYYMTSDELRAKIDNHLQEMRKAEGFNIDENATSGMERIFGKALECAKENDRIFSRLYEIAKTEGIEKATQETTRYAIIREVFPTPNLFRENYIKNNINVEDLFEEMSSVLIAHDETGEFIGEMMGVINGVMKKMKKIKEKFTTDYLNETIKEIYQ